jgi:hypothetical protein
MALAAGDRLGPYEILAPRGGGGLLAVYQARDTRVNREVALEVSGDHYSEDFERRARAVAELNHPHIRKLYEVGPNYLATEWVDGVPLKGPLPLQETLRFSNEICDALEYAHHRGVAHGDLKPANILVTRDGVKLLNFGLAEEINSDIYSFGRELYEMLMGRPITTDRRPVHPATLEQVMERCLTADPSKRFESVSELKQALAGVSPGGGHRREYIVVAGSVLMLIVGLALLVVQFPSNNRLTDKDVLVLGAFSNTTGDAIFDGTLRTALATQLEQSPFLKIMDDRQMQQDLKRMGRAPDTRISNAMAHEICVREHQKAMIEGAIADLGKTFAITIQAVDCQTGGTLAREQAQAEGREQVVSAISKAAIGIRAKLGEPPSSLGKPDGRSDPAAGGSIAAWQFYSLGIAQRRLANNLASIAFFQHAMDLDPTFALPYLGAGRAWAMAGDAIKAKKAYETFFAMCKDANPDLPLIAQASKEFAALK